GPRHDEDADENGGEPGEAEEGLTPELGRERPDGHCQRDETACPQARGRQMQVVRELREPRRVWLDRGMARERKPGREPERDQKCRPEEEWPLEQPREE